MKKSIKKKLLKFFLAVLVIPLFLTFAFTEISMLYLKSTSEELLIDQALESTQSFIDEKAVTINTQFDDIISNIYVARDYIEYLYANENDFQRLQMFTPDDFPSAITGRTLHWLPCSAKSDTEEVKNEAYLLSNLEPMLEATMNNCSTITSIYMTTKSGINIGYDENVLSKVGLGYFETREGYEWYTKPMESGDIYISDTYSDSFGRGLMVTISVPFQVDGAYAGVIAADINIENINNDILNLSIGAGGYAMLFTIDGRVISAEGLSEENNDPTKFLGTEADGVLKSLKGSYSGVSESVIKEQSVYIIYNQIENTGWKLVVVLPVENIIAPAQQSNAIILMINIIMIVIYMVVIIVMIYLVRKVCDKIAYPIIHLTQQVKTIGEGSLDYQSDIHTEDEIEALSEGFENMTLSLKEYIHNLTAVTAEKERIGAELNVATQIQASMLPCIFPAFPEREEFDIYATMQPAKEVGGDFYDFFLIDYDHLAVVMADVSGKGVPAALFMVIAKTLIKNQTQAGHTPAEVFTSVNTQLCENNEAGMFVTGWMGVLEISTGKFTYVNAGHNPPLIKKAEGKFEYLKSRAGFVLAGMEDIKYRQFELQLDIGDELYLYTDGVTEATDAHNELYGEERLQTVLNRNVDTKPSELLPAVKQDIDAFVKEAPQFDDITMLALKIRGRSDENTDCSCKA